jgi:hypothetical protein
MTIIVKEADFFEGFTKTLLEKYAPSQWMNKPFETIFSAIGPMLMWKISWPLGVMGFIGEHYGFGPGLVGKLIDQHLGAGSGKKLDLSDENLKAASESAVDEFMKKTQNLQTSSTNYVLDDLIKIKGSIKKEDVLAALYVSKYNKIQKEALEMPGANWIRKFLGSSKIGISSVLYGLIKMFAKGIIGAAAVGGVASMISGTNTDEKEKSGISEKSSEGPAMVKNKQYYSNVAKNVENTIIKFLNATIANFSTTFEKIYKRPLQGSKEIQEVLDTVESMNKSNISNINGWDSFMAPAILNIAYKIMPAATYEKTDKKETQKGTEDYKTKLMKLLNEV